VETQVHGALIDVLGVGVLLLGPSGIGKSECALELVQRGHRLAADDVVRVRRARDTEGRERLVGRAPELIRHYMELRGLGLIYIPELYGDEAVRAEAHIDLLCHLESWREDGEYERVGIDRPTEEIAGVRVPALTLPVRPAGGSLATLVEVACRDELQRRAGVNAARRLDERLSGGEGRQES
jgi:HPr kinase/phosphorylase